MALTSSLTLGTTYTKHRSEAVRLHLDTHDEAADVIRRNALARPAATNSFLLHTDPLTGEIVVENLGTGGRNPRNEGTMKVKAQAMTKRQNMLLRLRTKLRDKGVDMSHTVSWGGVMNA